MLLNVLASEKVYRMYRPLAIVEICYSERTIYSLYDDNLPLTVSKMDIDSEQMYSYLYPGCTDSEQVYRYLYPGCTDSEQVYMYLYPGCTDSEQVYSYLYPGCTDSEQVYSMVSEQPIDLLSSTFIWNVIRRIELINYVWIYVKNTFFYGDNPTNLCECQV